MFDLFNFLSRLQKKYLLSKKELFQIFERQKLFPREIASNIKKGFFSTLDFLEYRYEYSAGDCPQPFIYCTVQYRTYPTTNTIICA
jgi:hypothetical protein